MCVSSWKVKHHSVSRLRRVTGYREAFDQVTMIPSLYIQPAICVSALRVAIIDEEEDFFAILISILVVALFAY